MVRIGSQLEKEVKKNVTEFLYNNYDARAYNLANMKEVSREVIEHRLNTEKEAKVVKQMKRNFALDREEVIREKVNKLLNESFVSEVIYLKWLANVMLVKKLKGKWRVCIDSINLNKACPKDSYSVPYIDQVVDFHCWA